MNHTIQHKLGFTQNQYDLCVYNKSDPKKNGEKVMTRVHVDALNISSESKKKLNNDIDQHQLRNVFGEISEEYWSNLHRIMMIMRLR